MFKKIFILMSLVLSICIFAGCSNISASQALTDDEKANIITTIDSILETENLDADTVSFIKEKKEEFLSANTYEKQVEILEEINTKLEEKGIDISIAIPSIEREISNIQVKNIKSDEDKPIEKSHGVKEKEVYTEISDMTVEGDDGENTYKEAIDTEYETVYIIDKPGKEGKIVTEDHSMVKKTFWIADNLEEKCVYESSIYEDVVDKYLELFSISEPLRYQVVKPNEVVFNYAPIIDILDGEDEEGHFEYIKKED